MKHTNNLFKSVMHAFNGIVHASSERNVRIHFLATAVVLLTGSVLSLNAIEWAFIFSSIALVLITEFLNTCMEILCDLITADYSFPIKKIKDIAAASVVISALYALSISILILYPKISNYIYLTF